MAKKIFVIVFSLIVSVVISFGAENNILIKTKKDKPQNEAIAQNLTTSDVTVADNTKKTNEKDISKQENENRKVEISSEKRNTYEELFDKTTTKLSKITLFGKNIFNVQGAALQLPTEVEAGKDYILSSGDILRIRVFGDSLPQDITLNDFDVPVSLSGTIAFPLIGTFNLRGKSIMDAEKEINAKGQTKFRDFKIDISLAKMRSTRIFVMGEVAKPGTYILNPLSNLINALYVAGGITDNSSIRNVKILRNNKTVTVDLYDYFVYGKIQEVNTVLQEGDTIFIPVIEKEISIKGKVKRESRYELKNERTVEDIIKLAGGYNDKAGIDDIKVFTVEDGKVKVKEAAENYVLKNNDYIIIGGINDFVSNGVIIIGNVVKPGIYETKAGETLNDIISKAGGFLPNTYLKRIDIVNIDEDTKDTKNSYGYGIDNPELHAGDAVYIYSLEDAGENIFVTINGAVNNPGTYKVYKNSKLMDAVFLAKGLLDEDIYLNRADVLRLENDGMKKTIKVDLAAAKGGSGLENIVLKNYDKITIYKRSDVEAEKHVQVIGGVKNQGTFVLNNGSNRVSDIIFEARGLKEKDVYLNKASIVRNMANGELRLININLAKALEGEESENIILQDYDVLQVYTYNEVVQKSKINIYGDVRAPGSYDYYSKMTLDDLVFIAKNFDISADKENIEILRINQNNGNIETIKVNYNQMPQFELSEYDQIFIRKKSNWEEVRVVKVSGRVNYPGDYQVLGKDTLNSLIKRFGGFKEEAFPENTKIIRKGKITETLDNMNKRISMDLENLNTSGSAVKLQQAAEKDTKEIANFGYNKTAGTFRNDIVLEDGDEIVIPSFPATVKIIGEVYYPREVGFERGNGSFDYYLDSAGGFTGKALKEEVFVIKYDGKVKRNSLFSKVNIEAGDTIVVPYDPRIKKEFDFMEESLKIMQWLVTVFTAYKLIN